MNRAPLIRHNLKHQPHISISLTERVVASGNVEEVEDTRRILSQERKALEKKLGLILKLEDMLK